MSKDIIEDGFGSAADAVCPTCGERAIYVARPGDVRCSNCEDKALSYTGTCASCGKNFPCECKWRMLPVGTCVLCKKPFRECKCLKKEEWRKDMAALLDKDSYPLLYVKWVDIMNHQERLFVSTMKKKELTDVETVGFLIHEDDDKIILSQNIYHIPETPELTAENCMEIPKAVIKERRSY